MASQDRDYEDHLRALMMRKMEAELKKAELEAEMAQVNLETARMIREQHRITHEEIKRRMRGQFE